MPHAFDYHYPPMKRVLIILFLLSLCAFAQAPPAKRAHITGIDHVAFYTTDLDAVRNLYGNLLGLVATTSMESGEGQRYIVGSQWVGYAPAPDANSTARLDHVAFTTDDLEALRRQLRVARVKVPDQVDSRADGSHSFLVQDPEGNRVEFVQSPKIIRNTGAWPMPPVSHRIIHAGFTVRDRAAEDRFYKDLLGFHLYWQGGPQPDRFDWVAMQVPDGTDWLEYMLNQPEHLDLHRNGVMDHVSLGVPDIKQAQATLESRGWKSSQTEHAQMGRDGKWQLNLYDPDYTRIELMEFRPAQKPCCSEFQGPHPSD
jgi:catechol 2,3-dioxygenase-like lactoylglutathione lyase family enzyme